MRKMGEKDWRWIRDGLMEIGFWGWGMVWVW